MMTTFLVKQVNLGHGLLEGAIRDWGSENGGVPVSVVVLLHFCIFPFNLYWYRF